MSKNIVQNWIYKKFKLEIKVYDSELWYLEALVFLGNFVALFLLGIFFVLPWIPIGLWIWILLSVMLSAAYSFKRFATLPYIWSGFVGTVVSLEDLGIVKNDKNQMYYRQMDHLKDWLKTKFAYSDYVLLDNNKGVLFKHSENAMLCKLKYKY